MSRDELSEMIGLAERLMAAGEPAVLATLFSADGSTYRTLGSMMVSGPGSNFIAGGVSGGCLEEYIARRGRELIGRYDATMLSFDTDPDNNGDGVPSLGCGGSIEVLVERCTPEHLTFLRRLSAAQSSDSCSTVACVIDPTELPALTVRRVWFDQDDRIAEQPLEQLRQRAIGERRSRHGAIGGSRCALVHYVQPMTRLVLLGAGNDARPLCKLARSLGWHVTVADRRARLATHARFPEADQVHAADWWNALNEIAFTPNTAVVVMTHSVNDDAEILPLLSEKPAAYIGVLGPEHRLGWVLRDANATAALSEEFTARVRGPIGLDLGERSPDGIAVSIVSEILAELNRRAATPLSRPALRTCTEQSSKAFVEHV
jgi:xanthine dehydrogenase accessory factor